MTTASFDMWQPTKVICAGAMILGPKEVLEPVAKRISEFAKENHRTNHRLHEDLKEMAIQFAKTNTKEDKREWQELLTPKQKSALTTEEFIYFMAVPLEHTPEQVLQHIDKYVDKATLDWIEEQEQSYTQGTIHFVDPLLSKKRFIVSDRLKNSYEKLITRVKEEIDKSWYYLIGIEPYTTNSCMYGYDRRTLSDFAGKINNLEEEPFECAVREVREESYLDISSLINRSYFVNIDGTKGRNVKSRTRMYIIALDSSQKVCVLDPREKGGLSSPCQ